MTRRPVVNRPDAPPAQMPQITPGQNMDMAAFTMNATFELTNSVGRIEAKLDNLAEKIGALAGEVEKTNTRLSKIEGKATLVTGAILGAAVLLPICFTILWWALGERIEGAILRAPPPMLEQEQRPS